MPVYEYRCRTCGADFELRRPMAESSAPAPCPDGHADTLRRLSVVAAIGASRAQLGGGTSAGGGLGWGASSGSGCCGGGCGCGAR